MIKKIMDLGNFEYEEQEGDIVIITWKFNLYEFKVFKTREHALTDLWNAWKCRYALVHCSNEEIMKEHEAEIMNQTRWDEVVTKEGEFNTGT